MYACNCSELILWLSFIWACRFYFNITELKTLLQTDQLYVSRTVWAMIGKEGKVFSDTLSRKIPQPHTHPCSQSSNKQVVVGSGDQVQ